MARLAGYAKLQQPYLCQTAAPAQQAFLASASALLLPSGLIRLPLPACLSACSIERGNLFEQLCGLLSKTAFPVSGPLAAVHLQSLDGILAILAALADSCNGVSDLGGWLGGCSVGRPGQQRSSGCLLTFAVRFQSGIACVSVQA
jgi:hypothetical protein